MLKVHTSPLWGIRLRPSTGCTQTNLEWYLSGLPPARRKDIISLFIIHYDSELAYCCGKQWHFGVLPRRLTIENFVKLGQTLCISCQRSWKRKGLRISARWSMVWSQQDGWIHSADLPSQSIGHEHVSILCSYWPLKFCFCLHPALSKLQKCYFCVDDSLISGLKQPSHTLSCPVDPEDWQMVQSVYLDKYFDSG